MQDLLTIMRRLRGPGGCPWDQEQTHESLRPYLLEEAAEAADAAAGGGGPDLADELGDVLLQVAFHSVIGEEAGTFSYADVERSIVDKLVRRHPHVFADTAVDSSAEVVANWQAIKAAERGGRPRTALERVPAGLGALSREAQTQNLSAQKLAEQSRGDAGAQQVQALTVLQGAAPTPEGVAAVLSAVVAWARAAGVDPELALRDHTTAALRALDPAPQTPSAAP
ncbi:MazG family protein [Deinococcus arcticus]|uniref:Nucleoside triphosphate hydrolase n=1 Tax=Deinococcus arcticus TaxID=2136176 RepID=A0A2T3W5B5_9DEIO|nr:MazG family protein [Deinococcus arcticus]PTA66984.1 nucleoside triphosphate hydrolase [Deinococcus arcticus]